MPFPCRSGRWRALRGLSPEAAKRTLDRLHPRDAGRALATQPERFGTLPGKATWRTASPERREAMAHVRQAALTLGEIDTGRVRLTQALRLAHDHQRRGLELTHRALKVRLTTLPARLTLERQVASLVYKAGFKALSLVLPNPVMKVISLSLQAVAVMERTEGRGR